MMRIVQQKTPQNVPIDAYRRKSEGWWIVLLLQVRWQAKVFDMIHSSRFETAIMAMICLNMLVMMIQHYGQSEEVQFTLNILFTVMSSEKDVEQSSW